MTFLDILAAAGQTLLLAAFCFVVVCLLTSFLRFQALARGGDRVEAGGGGQDVLLVHLVQWLGTAHREPVPFVVLLARPGPEERGDGDPADRCARVGERLRRAVRAGDVVLSYRDDVVALLMPMRRPAVAGVVRRLQAETAREGWHLRFGAACHPEDGARAAELRSRAEAALAGADSVVEGPAWPPGASPPAAPTVTGHASLAASDQKALLDELTGVLQEQRLGPALQKYVAQFRREDQPVAVIVLDIDGLHRYNNQYGTKTGDRLLRHVADFLQKITREEDLIARHDGDQFVLALSATTAQALAIAQRILNGLRRTPIEGGGLGLRLTATLGVAAFPDHGLVAKELFQSAQQALQAAKAKGRNQCLLFQDSMKKPVHIGADSDAF